MKILLRVSLTLISIAYPFLWYYGRQHNGFGLIAIFMAVLWLARGVLVQNKAQKILSLMLGLFFVTIWVIKQPQSMYWYPVWVNGLMFGLFASSLLSKQSMIERMARLKKPNLPNSAIAYTRKVTQIWCVFFIINGGIVVALIRLEYFHWWAIYTGMISYILIGMLFAGEWLYRKLVLQV